MANVAAAVVTPVRRVLVARTVAHFFVIFYIYHYKSISFMLALLRGGWRFAAFLVRFCALLRSAGAV